MGTIEIGTRAIDEWIVVRWAETEKKKPQKADVAETRMTGGWIVEPMILWSEADG